MNQGQKLKRFKAAIYEYIEGFKGKYCPNEVKT